MYITFIPATLPTLNWVKSRCSLEYQYGNLTLFRLAEVEDSYLTDPTIKTVSIMRNDRFCRIPNKNFRGITIDVMDIYPVIKYCEIKVAERLAVIKEIEGKLYEHEYAEVLHSHDISEANDKVGSGEVNSAETINHSREKTTNNNSALSSLDKEENDEVKSDTQSNCKIVINHPLPPKPLRKKHTYELIDTGDKSASSSIIRKNSDRSTKKHNSSVYEVLDLALHTSSKRSSMKSSVEDSSPVVEVLDLSNIPTFRKRSITVSCKPPEEGSVVSDVKIAHQRSLQVAEELTKSLDSGVAEVKSKKLLKVSPVKDAFSNQITHSTSSKSSESFKNSLHLSIRNHGSRRSRKRYKNSLHGYI